MNVRIPVAVAALLMLLLAVRPATAHGVWAHVHVTGWAIQSLPDGELKDFLTSDPEVFNAALFGAVFTDSGYSPIGEGEDTAREYSEYAHWEPFVTKYIDWLRTNDPPPWEDRESRKRVALLMGIASHGMQDEVFDSLFLIQTKLHDGHGQESADPAMDGFLKLDGKMEFFPTPYVPMDLLLELFAGLKHDVTADVIQDAVGLITGAYINDELGLMIAQALGEQYEPELPWARQHYMDPEVPGSLASEIPVTAGYIQAIWSRLHGAFDHDAPVIGTLPEDGGCLWGVDAQTPDPWVTLVYGIGVRKDSPDPTWTGPDGGQVAFKMKGTRWGAHWTRLNRLMPAASLDGGGSYKVELGPGLDLIDGTVSNGTFSLSFGGLCAEVQAEYVEGEQTEDAAVNAVVDAAVVGPDQSSAQETGVMPEAGGSGCVVGASGGSGWTVVLLALMIIAVVRWKTGWDG
ncbi:MAG: hypothetical protein GXP54_02930 [Deltaproteobacteria bacterium]|nr:hypothetical protein [Deltaproteobacteria bacterium]